MNKISDIISTPIISLYESEYLGIIYNIMFDYKQRKIKYICILDESEKMPKVIKFSDIYKIGKNCIFIKNKSCIDLELNCDKNLESCTNPINLNTYNLDGEFLGTSNDIIINDKYELEQIILNNGKIINNKQIFNISNSAILVDNNHISLNKFKPKSIMPKVKRNEESKVIILSELLKPEQINNEPQKNINTSQQNTKILTDFRFLMGRILNKDIIAMNGEMIAKKNSIITKDIVNKASSYGKLVEIARYSNKK